MLASLNSLIVAIVDTAMRPLVGVPAVVSLMLLALATAIIILPIIAALSPQARVRQTKRLIHAALFEIRLFNDDPRAVMQSVRDALRHNLTYLRLSLLPLAVVSILVMGLMVHLHPYYGYSGLSVEAPALITVERNEGGAVPAVSLEVPGGIAVEIGPVELVGTREVLWRIRPERPGEFVVTVRSGEQTALKSVRVSDEVARRSPARVQAGLGRMLLYPSEPPLDPAGPISAISVGYPPSSLQVDGVNAHWSVFYLVFTMLWALVLARVFGIAL